MAYRPCAFWGVGMASAYYHATMTATTKRGETMTATSTYEKAYKNLVMVYGKRLANKAIEWHQKNGVDLVCVFGECVASELKWKSI